MDLPDEPSNQEQLPEKNMEKSNLTIENENSGSTEDAPMSENQESLVEPILNENQMDQDMNNEVGAVADELPAQLLVGDDHLLANQSEVDHLEKDEDQIEEDMSMGLDDVDFPPVPVVESDLVNSTEESNVDVAVPTMVMETISLASLSADVSEDQLPDQYSGATEDLRESSQADEVYEETSAPLYVSPDDAVEPEAISVSGLHKNIYADPEQEELSQDISQEVQEGTIENVDDASSNEPVDSSLNPAEKQMRTTDESVEQETANSNQDTEAVVPEDTDAEKNKQFEQNDTSPVSTKVLNGNDVTEDGVVDQSEGASSEDIPEASKVSTSPEATINKNMDKASPQSTTEVPAKADAVPDPSDGDSKSLNAKSSQQCIVCKKIGESLICAECKNRHVTIPHAEENHPCQILIKTPIDMQLCPRVSKNELSANRGQKTGKGKPDKASRILPVVIGSNRGRASALIKEKSQAVSKRGKGVARGTTSVSNTSVEPPLVSKSQPKTSQIEKGGGRGKGRGKGSSKTTNVSLNNCSVNSHVDSEIKVGKGGTRGRGSSSTSLKQSPLSPSLCIPIAKSAQATQLGKPVGKARGFSNIKEASLISQFLKSPITNSPNTPQSRNVSRRGRGRGINTTSKKQLQVSPSVCDYEDNTPDTPQIKRGSVKGKVSGNTPINKRSLVSSSLSNQLPNSPQSPQFVSSGSPYSGIIGVVQILSPGRDEESTSPKLQKSSSKIRGRSRGTSAAVIPQNYIEIKPIQLNAQKLFKVPVSNLTNLSSSQIIPQASPVLFTTSTRRTKVTPHKNMTTHGSLTNPATLPQVTDPVSSAVLKRQTGVHQQGRVATRKSSKTPVKKDSVDGQKENAPAVGIKNATAGQPDSSIHTKAHHTRARLVSRRERGMVHRLKEGIPSTKGISSKIIDSSIGTRFRGSIGRGHRPGKGRLRLGSLQAAGQSLVNDRDCDSIVRRSRRDRKVTEKFKEFKENETKVAAKQNSGTSSEIEGSIPIISSVVSLAPQTGPEINNFSTPVSNKAITPSPRGTQTTPSPRGTQTINVTQTVPKGTTGVQTKVTQQIIIQPPAPKPVKNKSVLCRPYTQTKATSCRPHTQTKETQTDENMGKPVLIPVPVPIYVPVPMRMYTTPVPHPMPIPVPIPFPCFIPTTKKNTESILKHVKEIQERIPADPFEAELLRMAEAVAKADDESDSDTSDDDGEAAGGIANEIPDQIPENQDEPPQEFGEDMLQMALRMASEMPDENVVAMDNSLSSTPGITESEYTDPPTLQSSVTPSPRRGRGKRRGGSTGGRGRPKKIKLEDTSEDPPAETPAPDENSMLKYTYGVNAWKHWVTNKNAEIARASTTNRGKVKPFKMEILQCTADELNFALCLFVKEVRKPNGEEYAPDSIYYLCLGIQAYIFEKARIDNIFTDIYFERFTDTLNEVLENYEVRLNAQGLIVCRIEEEHLWEAKQLGAHSPHVLLNTLVYFNTKFFMLKTTEDHLNLSFSHIMKHWKKTQLPGRQGTGRSVYLRYYAPTAAENTPKRKKEEAPVYEQAENLDNPLRCPVKLYEFYLSKCPESIKNRNDVFYLIPERSCVPDSPVWYSTGSLGEPSLSKMLNRIRWVRETQEAHLHNQPLFLPS